MAFLDETFSTDELPQGTGGDFTPLPDGWYTAHIAASSLETTKAGTGQYIKVRYDITGPTHQGRVVFGNLNIRNPNPKAEEIGRQQLGDLLRSIGVAKVSDTDQIVGGICQIKLITRTQEGYGPSNDIKGWKAVDGASMPKPAAKAEAKAETKAPWAR
tara:strand:+ start:96 stop:569 length:474 start_codon:yes stop_codon:yes gene_type:complete